MIFTRTPDLLSSAPALIAHLSQALELNEPVLWLVTGGSSIPLSVAVMASLPDDKLSNLTVMLTDERYGEVGHADSNAKQLYDAGFNSKAARFIPVLNGESLEITTHSFATNFGDQLAKSAVTIGQFGMGADGHIAGILPNSPAAFTTDSLAAGYKTDSFSRITLTFKAISKLQAIYVFAFGAEKHTALDNLYSADLPLTDQPAQLLKQVPECYIFNDYIGESEEEA